ncbi:MAG: hypothetical protein VYE77_06075 [Planctomycetota bacterium]|nr:hypothetical protein [Planctomycetota bacterium]
MSKNSKSKRPSGPDGELLSKMIGPNAPKLPVVPDPSPTDSESQELSLPRPVTVVEAIMARTGMSREEAERQMEMHGF